MKKLHGLKLSALFSIVVFAIQIICSSIFPTMLFFAMRAGLVIDPNPMYLAYTICITSVIFGMLLARIVGRTVLKPIIALNEATKRVAKGDFDITLQESGFGREFHEMARSFNIMTKELKNIETFRNDFVTDVSHEFKTPISAIEGYATLLQDDGISKEEQNDYIERIISSCRRLSNLSGNILMISKLENQEIVLDKTSFSLDEQIRNIILSLEPTWSGKNISLDINLENVMFYGNKSMLSHVWHNLITNAVKFTPNGGLISVNLTSEGGHAVVSVGDTGIGMSKETLKYIFDKFYCADKSRYGGGNGLGLALVKRIVELCGGVIEVKSEKNLGSEFTVSLPNGQT